MWEFVWRRGSQGTLDNYITLQNLNYIEEISTINIASTILEGRRLEINFNHTQYAHYNNMHKANISPWNSALSYSLCYFNRINSDYLGPRFEQYQYNHINNNVLSVESPHQGQLSNLKSKNTKQNAHQDLALNLDLI